MKSMPDRAVLLLSLVLLGSGAFAADALIHGVLAHPTAPQSRAGEQLIEHVNVVDVRTGRVSGDQAIVIAADRILWVGPSAGREKVPDGRIGGPKTSFRVVDGRGLYVTPGLWDMHVHLQFGDWFPGAREISLPLLVANGVTGVRDMGSDLETVQAWRAEIAGGRLVGPRIYTSGPMLDGPKPRFPSSIAVSSPEEGRRAVDELQKRAADFIKLQSLIPRPAVWAIAEEAKQRGISFAGHVPDAMRASEMSGAGMKSFEHLIGIFEGSSEREDEFLRGDKNVTKLLAGYQSGRAVKLAALLAKNRTWQCPTLVWERGGNLLDVSGFASDPRMKYVPEAWRTRWKLFEDEIRKGYATDDLTTRKQFLAKELEVVALLHRAGVPFLAGTDTPPGVAIFPGFSLHEELQRLVDAGFTPLEALQTATVNPAEFFGIADRAGTVEPGRYADLLLLQGNPVASISNTTKVAAVMAAGKYFDGKALAEMFTEVEASAKARSAIREGVIARIAPAIWEGAGQASAIEAAPFSTQRNANLHSPRPSTKGVYPNDFERTEGTDRVAAGHAGPADPADLAAGPHARPRHR